MNQSSLPTRLREYISALLPDAHGHQRNAITDFVFALITVQSCCQSTIARFFDNYEAAAKRLARFLHNERIDVAQMCLATAALSVAQLPRYGPVRVAIDWTIEDQHHLLVASLVVRRRAVPIFWRAYGGTQLKGKTSDYEQELICTLITEVLSSVARERLIITADRGFADVILFDLFNELGVTFIIRTKGNVKVYWDGEWRKLNTLRFRGNERRRSLGRLRYCESDPRRFYVVHSRAREGNGRWGIWYLVSNRESSAHSATTEYGRRFGGEEGFRDAKRMLGFADARIEDLKAWARMFILVAIALLVLVGVGSRLIEDRERTQQALRRMTSRRKRRSMMSLVRLVAELIKGEICLYELLTHDAKLNLEAAL